MGWLVSGGASAENTSSNSNAYGTRTPIISQQATDAFNAYKAPLNASGANAPQQQSLDWLSGNLKSNPVGAQVNSTNGTLGDAMSGYGWINQTMVNPMATQAAHTLSGTPTSADAPQVDARTGASFMAPYEKGYTDNVVNSTLSNMDQATSNKLAGLRAERGAGSAFGDRANLADGAFLNQEDLNRAQTEAQLRDQGFTRGASLGQQDAGNWLSASGQNASNKLNNNQFNASLLDSDNKFNVNSENQNDQTKLAAAKQVSDNLERYAGLSQQQLQNVVTANGINVEAAQSLLAAGSITQSQLETILGMAQQYNGSSYTDNRSGSSTKLEAHAGFG